MHTQPFQCLEWNSQTWACTMKKCCEWKIEKPSAFPAEKKKVWTRVDKDVQTLRWSSVTHLTSATSSSLAWLSILLSMLSTWKSLLCGTKRQHYYTSATSSMNVVHKQECGNGKIHSTINNKCTIWMSGEQPCWKSSFSPSLPRCSHMFDTDSGVSIQEGIMKVKAKLKIPELEMLNLDSIQQEACVFSRPSIIESQANNVQPLNASHASQFHQSQCFASFINSVYVW